MSSHLVIRRPPSSTDEPASWLWLDAHGAVIESGEDTLDNLAARLAVAETEPVVVVLVPAAAVTLMEVDIPAGQRRYLRKALPFVVEEFIADELEDVHIATGPMVRNQPVPLAIVRHSELIHWLDAIYSAGIAPDLLVPEQLAVPWHEGELTVLVEGGRCLLRTGAWAGTAFDLADAAVWLHKALREHPDARRITLISGYDDSGDPTLATLAAELDESLPDGIQRVEYREPVAEVLAAESARAADNTIDLLQGGYRIKRQQTRRYFDWRKVVVVAAICAAFNAVLAIAAGSWYHWEGSRLRSESVAAYRQIVPNAHRIFDPKKQLESYLRVAGPASAGFFNMLAPVADAWNKDSKLVIDRLDYDDSNATLTLQISGPSAQPVTALQSALAANGLRANVTSMVEQGGGVSARIQVGS